MHGYLDRLTRRAHHGKVVLGIPSFAGVLQARMKA
jgi:hypothetical protein